MKKLLVVLAILFTGILLMGCTSQPAAPVATPTPAPTAVPTTVIPTAVPTVIPTTAPVVIVNTTPTATPTPTPTPAPQPSVTITFTKDLTITPGTTVYIPVGGVVMWKNNDPFKPHAIQAINVQSGQYFGSLNPITIPYGKCFNVTFPKVGRFDYQTIYQPAKTGTIIVTAQ